ncbi:hypothetical protein [Streptomyces sp. NPDC001492]
MHPKCSPVLPREQTSRPAEARLTAGVETVYGDADDPASLDAAFAGASGAFLMSGQGVGTAPGPTHDLALAEAEAAVTDPSRDWAWTLLRPGRFMSNALRWAAGLRAGDEVAVPFADRPAASIDPADPADIAALALTGDEHADAA